MTDKTYRIKPLVWKKHGRERYADSLFGASVRVWEDGWQIYTVHGSGSSVVGTYHSGGDSQSIEQAKLAAESAYRALLTEALEEVQ